MPVETSTRDHSPGRERATFPKARSACCCTGRTSEDGVDIPHVVDETLDLGGKVPIEGIFEASAANHASSHRTGGRRIDESAGDKIRHSGDRFMPVDRASRDVEEKALSRQKSNAEACRAKPVHVGTCEIAAGRARQGTQLSCGGKP